MRGRTRGASVLFLGREPRTPLEERPQIDGEGPRISRLIDYVYDFATNCFSRDEVIRILVVRCVGHAWQSNRPIDVERDRVDAAMHKFVGDGFGDRALRYLRRVVGSILRGAAARLRSEHEDDGAGTALGHPGDYRLSAEERAVAVDLELEVEILFRDFRKRFAQVGAGVVDEHRDGAEFALHCGDGGNHLIAL